MRKIVICEVLQEREMMQDGLLQSSIGAVDTDHGRTVGSASMGVSRKHGCLPKQPFMKGRSGSQVCIQTHIYTCIHVYPSIHIQMNRLPH